MFVFDVSADCVYLLFCTSFPQGNSDRWCSDLLKASEEFLSNGTLKQDSINDELLMRHLFTVGEVAQVCYNELKHSKITTYNIFSTDYHMNASAIKD